MLIKAFNTKQTTQTFLVNINKIIKNLKKNNLTVVEPKYPLRGCYRSDAIPSSQTATVNTKC